MDRGQERAESPAAAASPVDTTALEGADVVEIRPVENFRVCSACLVVNSADDAFCTACGTALASAQMGSVVRPPIVIESQPEVARDGRRGLRGRHWLAVGGVFAVFLCGAVGTTAFGVLWHNETLHAKRLSADLARTRGRLDDTRAKLAGTAASLRATSSLAQRRKAVLLRAETVLKKVDPILSSVDELQNDTGDIQSQRDTFTNAADTLISDTITLANYLIQTDPAYIDAAYEQQLIDTANADLATVRADEASLGSSDSSYDSASKRFGNRADSFTKAVRGLQQQLRKAASR